MTTPAEDACKKFFTETCNRIEAVIRMKYPTAIAPDGEFREWAQANHASRYRRMKTALNEMDALWKNGQVEQMKKMCTEWGREYLELAKQYCLSERMGAAA